MIKLYVCEHQLGLLIRAVKAYKPAADEKTDHKDLVEYLTARTAERVLSVDLDPEDIPF